GLTGILLLIALPLLSPQRADAKTGFAMVGYDDETPTLAMLAREVSHRTSIELEPKPASFSALQPEAMLEPWIWVRKIQTITDKTGRLKGEVALWLKRGGFLVIEAALATPELARLTQNLAHGGEDKDGRHSATAEPPPNAGTLAADGRHAATAEPPPNAGT